MVILDIFIHSLNRSTVAGLALTLFRLPCAPWYHCIRIVNFNGSRGTFAGITLKLFKLPHCALVCYIQVIACKWCGFWLALLAFLLSE